MGNEPSTHRSKSSSGGRGGGVHSVGSGGEDGTSTVDSSPTAVNDTAAAAAKKFGDTVTSAIRAAQQSAAGGSSSGKGGGGKRRRDRSGGGGGGSSSESDHPAQFLIDNVCGQVPAFFYSATGAGAGDADDDEEESKRGRDGGSGSRKGQSSRGGSSRRRRDRDRSYSEEDDYVSVDDSRTISDEETIDDYDRRGRRRGGGGGMSAGQKALSTPSESSSFVSQSITDEYVDANAGTADDKKGRVGRRPGGRRRDDDSQTTADSEFDDESLPVAGREDRYHSEGGKGVSGHHHGGRKSRDASSIASSGIQGSDVPSLLSKPLASSFAKRCYFTKAGIGKTTPHYEGLTLTGNVVLMLASAMKLKGCPTICDEDLRRVEQTYPNQFSRLPDELLLSSGWRRISKYCHFSNKPIPDGVPFFHSKERLHPQGGYYFLLAAAVGMVRPIDVEPLTRDTLTVLETDFPSQCDAAPDILIQDPNQWSLVDKFCFFSGGPINTEEDVYYRADFDGNDIYMLAFLSPSLTPEELYRLGPDGEVEEELGLKSVAAVEEVESVYDLTARDFEDLKLYHLGPCRALPQYILQANAWTKVLPPHFLASRQKALDRAREYETANPQIQPMNDQTIADSSAGGMGQGMLTQNQQQAQQQFAGAGVQPTQGYGDLSGGYVELAPGLTGQMAPFGMGDHAQGGGGYYGQPTGWADQHQQLPLPGAPYHQHSHPSEGDYRSATPNVAMEPNMQQQLQNTLGGGGAMGMPQDMQMNSYYQQQSPVGLSGQADTNISHPPEQYNQQPLASAPQRGSPPVAQPDRGQNLPQEGPFPVPYQKGPNPNQKTFSFYDPEVGFGTERDNNNKKDNPSPSGASSQYQETFFSSYGQQAAATNNSLNPNEVAKQLQREVEEEGAFVSTADNSLPIDEAIATRSGTLSSPPPDSRHSLRKISADPPLTLSVSNVESEAATKMDPPDDEPPSLAISGSKMKETRARGKRFAISPEEMYHDIPDDERKGDEPPQIYPDSPTATPTEVPTDFVSEEEKLPKTEKTDTPESRKVQRDLEREDISDVPSALVDLERSYYDDDDMPAENYDCEYDTSYDHDDRGRYEELDRGIYGKKVRGSLDQTGRVSYVQTERVNSYGESDYGHGNFAEEGYDSPIRDEEEKYYSPGDRGRARDDYYDEGNRDDFSPQRNGFSPEQDHGYSAVLDYGDYGNYHDDMSPRDSHGTSSYTVSPPSTRPSPRGGGGQFVPIQMNNHNNSRQRVPPLASQGYSDGEHEPDDKESPQQNHGKPHSSPDSGISTGSGHTPAEGSAGSDYTPSSAMRGAQQLLRKNRQRRLAMASRRGSSGKKIPPLGAENDRTDPQHSPQDDEAHSETGTGTSVVSGSSIVSGSSVWTENTNPADRSSRRALILQMAKARMKSNRQTTNHVSGVSGEEKSPKSSSIDMSPGKTVTPTKDEQEEPLNGDLDFSGDLD